jgi:hypothetical protein
MIFTIDASWGVVHEDLDFLGTPARQMPDLDRLREARNTFEIVVNRGTADVKLFREFFDCEILRVFPHLLPVNKEAKDMRQQPRQYKQYHDGEELFSL